MRLGWVSGWVRNEEWMDVRLKGWIDR